MPADVISYKTKKGDTFDYNPRESKFVKPEIQGILEKTLKAGVVQILSKGYNFRPCLLVLCDMGFIVLELNSVGSLSHSMLSLILCHLSTVTSARFKTRMMSLTDS